MILIISLPPATAGFHVSKTRGQGPIDAQAADGSRVPMHWYYRSRNGVAALKVAMLADECPGPNPLFMAKSEQPDEFDHTHWIDNIRQLIPQLEPVSFLNHFVTFALGEDDLVDPRVLEVGMSPRQLAHAAATDPQVRAVIETLGGSHAVFETLMARGDTPAEALAHVREFRVDEHLLPFLDAGRQKLRHENQLQFLDPEPFNPWLGLPEVDGRTRPSVELAEQPFTVDGVE